MMSLPSPQAPLPTRISFRGIEAQGLDFLKWFLRVGDDGLGTTSRRTSLASKVRDNFL